MGAAGIGSGQSVLDIGCGTGNALIAAAERATTVTGVDPSERLLERARGRMREAGVDGTVAVGRAEELPVEGASFDVTLSVFAVIFASDPDAAVAEMVRATAPGGTIVITSWLDEGGAAEAGRILNDAVPADPGPSREWHDREWIRALLGRHGAGEVSFTRHELAFSDGSPEEAFAALEGHHPAWRAARRGLGESRWNSLREATEAAFRAANEDPDGFRMTAPFLVTRARVPRSGAA